MCRPVDRPHRSWNVISAKSKTYSRTTIVLGVKRKQDTLIRRCHRPMEIISKRFGEMISFALLLLGLLCGATCSVCARQDTSWAERQTSSEIDDARDSRTTASSRALSTDLPAISEGKPRVDVFRSPRVSDRASKDYRGLPPADPEERPHFDLVVAVLVTGGGSQEAIDEIAHVRQLYSRYGESIVPDKSGQAASQSNSSEVALVAPLTFKLVFVVGSEGLPEGVPLSDAGVLLGDFFYVDIREGYRFLGDKTKAMMALSEHLSFRFLAKTDSDTFPCLSYIAHQLLAVPVDQQPQVYAGSARRREAVRLDGKFGDPDFAEVSQLSTYPTYHLGAFYILGERLVCHLHRSRDVLSVFFVEDAMVGVWLLGVNKVILDIGDNNHCGCDTDPTTVHEAAFSHTCRSDKQMESCTMRFGSC